MHVNLNVRFRKSCLKADGRDNSALKSLVIVLGLAAPLGIVAATPAYAINRGYTIDAAYNQQAFLYQASVKAAALAAGYDSKFRDQQAEINRRNTKISELRTALRQNGANATALKGQIDLL